MISNKKLIIFDCDGTLVDTEYSHNKAVSDFFVEDLGYKQFTLEYSFKHFMGKGLQDIFAIVEAETGDKISEEQAAQCITKMNSYIPKYLKPIDGVHSLLTKAAERYKICVGSNGELVNVMASLDCTDLRPFFKDEELFVKDMVESAKPAPDLYLYAANKMGAAPEECIVIEDSIPGAQAGLAAGMDVIGFTGVHHDKTKHIQALRDIGVTTITDQLIHIEEILDTGKGLVQAVAV